MSETSNSNNLDLSSIPSEDLGQLAHTITQFYSSDTPVKSQLTKQWERIHMMLDGKQWLQFDSSASSGSQWNNLSVSKANEYVPRPVTNLMFDCYQTLKSYLIKNKPRSKVFPQNPTSYTDSISAQIATLCCEANWVRLKEQYNYETAAANLTMYGTVFKKSFWDTSVVSTIKVPRMIMKPATDPNTGMEIPGSETEVQEEDPITGDPIFDELPLGDLSTTVIEPHRITIDPLAVNLHEAKWIMESSIQTLDWIKDTYGKEGEGFTGLAEEVKDDKDLNNSMRRWYSLRNSSGAKEGSLNTGQSGGNPSSTMVDNSAVVYEVYERPSRANLKGRMIVVAGNKVLFVGPSPYEGPELGDWHPYSECRWEIFPGRFHGKGPMDAIVEPQKRLNTIDSIVTLTRKTSGAPQKLIPTTVGVTPGAWTGRPNAEIYYRPDGTGAKPETIPATGVDPSVFTERTMIASEIKELSGAIDILRGDRPQGVNAASALSLLYEVGTGKLYPIMDRWKAFVENDQRKQLLLIQKHYKEPRPEYIRLIQSLNKDLAESDINYFIGTDLNDHCNVVIEAGSNIPKLQAAQQSLLMQLAQMGMLNLQDPSNRAQFQKDLGIVGYDSDVEPDIKRARFENTVLDNVDTTPNNRPIVLACDNHQLHIMEHEIRMKSPNFLACAAEVQQAYNQHLQEHQQFIDMANLSAIHQQMAGIAPQGPVSVGPSGPTPKAGGTQHGGPSTAVKNVINGGPDLMNVATIGSTRN